MKQITDQIIPILLKYGVSRASLFGSFARGDERPNSDIDILVELPTSYKGFAYVGLRLDIQEELEKSLNKKIDLVEYKLIKDSLRESILQNQIPLLPQNL